MELYELRSSLNYSDGVTRCIQNCYEETSWKVATEKKMGG